MPPGFVRSHAECQYQFLKANAEEAATAPTLADGLKVQEVMEAAARSSQEGRWMSTAEVR
jgi:predicted dehydrogenase